MVILRLMSNVERAAPREELSPKVIDNLLAKIEEWNAETWGIQIDLTKNNLRDGKRELAEPSVIKPYIYAMLKNRAEKEDPRLIPFIDLFWQHAPADILDTGFERVFLGEQIRGRQLEVGIGTPAIFGNESPDLLPYRSPPTSYMLIFDREIDQVQSVQRFAAVVDGKISIIDAYSDPRSPAIIPMKFLSDIGNPQEKAEVASRVSSEAGSAVEFNTGKRKKSGSLDELFKMKEADLCCPEDNDEINRYLRIMRYVEAQNKIKILGEVPLPELGCLGIKNYKERVPVYGALDPKPLYLDWNRFFNALNSRG